VIPGGVGETYFRVFTPTDFTDDLVVILCTPLYRQVVYRRARVPYELSVCRPVLSRWHCISNLKRSELTVVPPRSTQLFVHMRVDPSLFPESIEWNVCNPHKMKRQKTWSARLCKVKGEPAQKRVKCLRYSASLQSFRLACADLGIERGIGLNLALQA
jgi:hypothetical protein